jgi:hypothetical protein
VLFADVVARPIAALERDDTVLGGANVKKLEAATVLACRAQCRCLPWRTSAVGQRRRSPAHRSASQTTQQIKDVADGRTIGDTHASEE